VVTLTRVTVPGTVLQVQHTQVTATSSTSAMSASATVDVTPLNVAITPFATSSKIKIELAATGEISAVSAANNVMFWLKRTIGGTTTNLRAPADVASNALGIAPPSINLSSNIDSTLEAVSFVYFDAPSTTSEITYQLVVTNGSQDGAIWNINRTASATGGLNYERGISIICATEIAG
tara:strand:- start:63 stop:596 length:534 start_codon:yes stop_codon:yes gene_type:complete